LPRRHTSSAAGALAAVLIAAAWAPAASARLCAAALSWDSRTKSSRRPSLHPGPSKRRPRKGAGESTAGWRSRARRRVPRPFRTISPTISLFCRSLQRRRRPSGGLGDQPAETVTPVPGIGITEPNGAPLTEGPGTEKLAGTNQPLPPKGRKLDPYVPIGMKLGSFLLFSEAEVGTSLTDNEPSREPGADRHAHPALSRKRFRSAS
jgi:hypothetical protein